MQISVGGAVHALRVLADARLIRPVRPDELVRLARIPMRWGFTPAAGIAASALRYPGEPAVIDPAGVLTFAELHERSSALADGLVATGVLPGDRLGLLCRNNRAFVETTLAASKLGVRLVLLNTNFAAPQLRDVVEREGVTTIVYDEEFAPVVIAAELPGCRRISAGADPRAGKVVTLDALVTHGDPDNVAPPPKAGGGVVLLTSGTTGRPKGA
ncbi:MAG: AMP-binding protein, partial [Mycobacteriales bacterium]